MIYRKIYFDSKDRKIISQFCNERWTGCFRIMKSCHICISWRKSAWHANKFFLLSSMIRFTHQPYGADSQPWLPRTGCRSHPEGSWCSKGQKRGHPTHYDLKLMKKSALNKQIFLNLCFALFNNLAYIFPEQRTS